MVTHNISKHSNPDQSYQKARIQTKAIQNPESKSKLLKNPNQD